MSKRLVGGIIGCKDKASSWHLIRFPDGIVTLLGQQYNMSFNMLTSCSNYYYRGCGKERRTFISLSVVTCQAKQHSFGTTLRLTGPVPTDSRYW